MNNLQVERIYELEHMIINNDIKFPLNQDDWHYIKKAKKLSIYDTKNIISSYNKILMLSNKEKYIKEIIKKYNCTEYEIYQRMWEVNELIIYQNLINNSLLKEQKRMIKRMNKR